MRRLLAVSIGRGEALFTNAGSVQSGIRKTPVSTLANPHAIALGAMGVEGDEQVDRSVHGGLNQAVYLYPSEHYPVWQTIRQQALQIDEPLPFGFMGENLTTEGLLETDLWVGDSLQVGPIESGVLLVVTKPRAPCFKFNARMGFKHAAKMMVQSAYTGTYCAVMRNGTVSAGDSIVVTPGERVIRIDEKHRIDTGRGQSDIF
jgi:MOSC domain-containing protein YiiM